MAMASPLKAPGPEFQSGDNVVVASESTAEMSANVLTTQPPSTTTTQLSSTTTENNDIMAKKPKLSAREKAELKAAKEAEAQRKAEEKARKEEAKEEAKRQKEEEKRQKEEEKRQKEEEKRHKEEERRQKLDEARREKEEKQKVKDAAKAEKDAEKKAKEEAQAKKEKAQMRLGAFFKMPATEAGASGSSSRRSSIASVDVDMEQVAASPLNSGIPQISDYEKTFPPFFLHPHTKLAPIHRYDDDEAQIQCFVDEVEKGLQQSQEPRSVLGKRRRNSYIRYPTVKKLMLEMQGSNASNAIDLETDKPDRAAKMLKSYPVKYLKFKEDVRPPWIGTFSRAPEGQKYKALCRNPFRRELPGVNYDYDSEAEWEEPEEGEELNSEGEEEDDEDDEDMGEFLDDDAAEALPKRKQLVGDLEPVYTDLHWESATSRHSTAKFGTGTIDLEQFRISVLLDSPVTFPIDPFSTSYWAPATPVKPQPKLTTIESMMQPPPARVPLNTIQGPNQLSQIPAKPEAASKAAKILAAAKPLPPELLPDFKKAVSGSVLSKIGLIEVLKKDFPQITKKTVEQTLLQIAKRVGKKEAEKVWQLNEEEAVTV